MSALVRSLALTLLSLAVPNEAWTVVQCPSTTLDYPIDLNSNDATPSSDPPLRFTNFDSTLDSATLVIKDDGRIVFEVSEHDAFISGGHLNATFKVHQFELHFGPDSSVGSDHKVDGIEHAMEVEIIAYNDKYDWFGADNHTDGYLVLAVLYDEGTVTQNDPFEDIKTALNQIPAGESSYNVTQLPEIEKLMPTQQQLGDYFRYKSAFTPYSCNEANNWVVFTSVLDVTPLLLEALRSMKFPNGTVIGSNNLRPLASLLDRTVHLNNKLE